MRGSFLFGDVAIEKFRLIAVIVGLVVFAAMVLLLNRTKIGLLIRAGVENKEMVEAMGYRIRRLFVGVFVAGSALAGLGGALWGMYQESVTVAIGAHMMVLIFIVIIIGGLGSVGGCFVGAILVGLVANYVGYPLAQDRAWLQHPADGDGAAVAAAGSLPGKQAMIHDLLSGDAPRSRILSAMLAAILVALALAPFLFPGTRPLDVAAKVCVFVLLVASYDLLLGYTGIVSFAHTMFFGIGGYGVAIALSRLEAGWIAIALGTAAAVALSLALSFLIGLFSLRVKAIFFAMITLAVASFFAILASQLSNITGGEDGITFRVPEILRPAFRLLEEPLLGVAIGGRFVTYYLVFGCSLALFLALLRVVNSPFGRVLLAIRENEFRAEALGYRTVIYRTIANCLGAVVATLAGALYALWLRYTGPNTTLDFGIMIDILLMVVIGGMGTMYGAVIGATIFVVAQNYLQDAMEAFSGSMQGVPLLPDLFHPDRWLLWLGVLFVLSVYYFPYGIVGQLRARLRNAATK